MHWHITLYILHQAVAITSWSLAQTRPVLIYHQIQRKNSILVKPFLASGSSERWMMTQLIVTWSKFSSTIFLYLPLLPNSSCCGQQLVVLAIYDLQFESSFGFYVQTNPIILIWVIYIFLTFSPSSLFLGQLWTIYGTKKETLLLRCNICFNVSTLSNSWLLTLDIFCIM